MLDQIVDKEYLKSLNLTKLHRPFDINHIYIIYDMLIAASSELNFKLLQKNNIIKTLVARRSG